MLIKVTKFLPIIVCLSLFSTAQATDNESPYFCSPDLALSPDKKKLAIGIDSNGERSYYVLFIGEATPYLMPVLQHYDVWGATWGISDTNSTLYLLGEFEDDCENIFEYKISEGGFQILEKVPLKKNCIFVKPVWNDDGTILAMRMTPPFDSGQLVFSYDQGRTINTTGFKIGGGELVWKGRSTIFIQDANNTIYKIKITGTNAQIEKKWAFEKNVRLAGSLGGQPIYLDHNEIRRVENNDLLYTAKDGIGPGSIDDGYIVFSACNSNEIVLLNDRGKELHRRIIAGEKCFITMTFAAKEQALYFVGENYQVIKN